MTTPSNPFAALAEQNRAAQAARAATPNGLPTPAPAPQAAPTSTEPAPAPVTTPVEPEKAAPSAEHTEHAASSEDMPDNPPKRKRGRPRKHPLPEPSDTSDTESDTGTDTVPAPNATPADDLMQRLAMTPPDKVWVDLTANAEEYAAKAKEVEEEVDVAEKERVAAHSTAESLRAQITALEAELKGTLEAEEVAQYRAVTAQDKHAKYTEAAEDAMTVRATVEDYLVHITGGKSGTFGAVRITVVDGKSFFEKS